MREERSRSTEPIHEEINTVEPAYLQITCSQLWNLERNDPERTLRLATYTARGRAQGLLQAYVENTLNALSASEKKLASPAFDHLITRRGTKMAYTVPALAQVLEVDARALQQVLERLHDARILRRQQRHQDLWYELYHDLWSDPLETWNTAYKAKQRNRRAALLAGVVLVVGFVAYAAYDFLVNITDHHLRLSVKEGISDNVELHRGKAGSWDLFGRQRYLGETGYQRTQIEPDKRFTARPVVDFDQLNAELMTQLPLAERIVAYWSNGEVEKAEGLSKTAIADDHPERAREVITAAAEAKAQQGLSILQERLRKITNSQLQRQIVLAIGEMGIPESSKVLSSFQDQDPFLRQSAAEALGQLGDARAVAPLLLLLKDTASDVRRSAAEALGQLGDARAVDPILPLLRDPASEVRRRAIEALGRLEGSRAVDPILPLLKDPASEVRRRAIEALGQLGDARVVDPILPLLKDPDWGVRQRAIEALGQLGDARLIETYLQVLQNPKEQNSVKLTVATANLTLGRNEGNSIIKEMLNSKQSRERQALAIAFSQVPSPEGNKLLLTLLSDTEVEVRIAAINAMGYSKLKDFAVHLMPLLENSDRRIQHAAISALAALATPDSLPAFRSAVHNTQLMLPEQLEVLKGLRNIGSEEAITALLDVAERGEPSLRLRAYRLLGEMQARQALSLLSARLAEYKQQIDAWRTRRDARQDDASQDLKEKELQAITPPRPASTPAFVLADALARIDPQGQGFTLLSHDLADVRQGAWLGLGSVGTVELIKALDEKRTTSRDPLFRQAAYRAIDAMLTQVEARGGTKERTTLERWLPTLQQKPDVYARVEWTTLRLQWEER